MQNVSYNWEMLEKLCYRSFAIYYGTIHPTYALLVCVDIFLERNSCHKNEEYLIALVCTRSCMNASADANTSRLRQVAYCCKHTFVSCTLSCIVSSVKSNMHILSQFCI